MLRNNEITLDQQMFQRGNFIVLVMCCLCGIRIPVDQIVISSQRLLLGNGEERDES
jgi:hypothetical protein